MHIRSAGYSVKNGTTGERAGGNAVHTHTQRERERSRSNGN